MKLHSTVQFLILYLSSCNLLDGIVTFWGLQHGWIGEVNPFMRAIYHLHPLAFLLYKIVLSTMLLCLLLQYNRLKSILIRILLGVASVIYTVLLSIHAYWIFILSLISRS
ncbi:MAG: DUF5658 family protein [Anaerobacillus sp.]